jgi:hypothetical protein
VAAKTLYQLEQASALARSSQSDAATSSDPGTLSSCRGMTDPTKPPSRGEELCSEAKASAVANSTTNTIATNQAEATMRQPPKVLSALSISLGMVAPQTCCSATNRHMALKLNPTRSSCRSERALVCAACVVGHRWRPSSLSSRSRNPRQRVPTGPSTVRGFSAGVPWSPASWLICRSGKSPRDRTQGAILALGSLAVSG